MNKLDGYCDFVDAHSEHSEYYFQEKDVANPTNSKKDIEKFASKIQQ